MTDNKGKTKVPAKEITTSVLAILIVGTNIVLLFLIYWLSQTDIPVEILTSSEGNLDLAKERIRLWDDMVETRFDRAKDVLVVATGFLGIVLGFYFGRIPTEKALDKVSGHLGAAQGQAEHNAAEAAVAKKQKDNLKSASLETLAAVKSGDVSRFTAESAGGQVVAEHPALSRLRQAIDDAD